VNRALVLAAALAFAAAGRLVGQEPPPPPPRDTAQADSVRADSARADSLRAAILLADSLYADSLRADSLAHVDTAAVRVTTAPPVVSTWRIGMQPAYRRSPHLGLDPFRYALVPHWGLVIGAGGSGVNNSFNASDVGALKLIKDRDTVRAVDGMDALGLVPTGKGLLGFVQGGGTVHLGGPFGRHFALGFTGEGHAYSSFHLDDNTVALLRDGNGARQDFSLGVSRGAALATAEGGVHAVLRFGATDDDDPGLRVIAGIGARYLKPLAFGRGGPVSADGGTIRLTGDSIAINTQVESEFTYQAKDAQSALTEVKGSGMAMDYLLRFELPRPGLAFEVSLSNVGSVKVQGVERGRANISGVRAASLKELRDILMYRDSTITPRQLPDTGSVTTYKWKLKPQYDFQVRDTTEVTVTLPRVLRLAASAWVLPMLQFDASYTAAVSGDFTAPAIVEAGATLRLLRGFPLRVGIVRAGGDYGNGFTAGFGIETRGLYLDVSGAFIGSAPKTATGGGGRVEFGFFF